MRPGTETREHITNVSYSQGLHNEIVSTVWVGSQGDLWQPLTTYFHLIFCTSHLSQSITLSPHPPASTFSNDALALPFTSVDALTLISMIKWEYLLLSFALSFPPSGLHPYFHSPSLRPLVPFLFWSYFHQTLDPWSHLHSLNQLLSTHPYDPISFHHVCPSVLPPFHPSSLHGTHCPSYLAQLASDHSASMNLKLTWSNLTLWPVEFQYSKWGYRPHALSPSITVSSRAKSCDPFPLVNRVSDRCCEQIRHQKTRCRGSIHFPRLSSHRLWSSSDRWFASNY